MNINRHAPIVASHNITIASDIQIVWDALTQIDRWPDWNTEIPSARLNGRLAAGTAFQW